MFDISGASVLETGIWAARFENTWYVLAPPRWANGLALSDHVRAEQVKLDSSGDVGDAGLAGLAGGEVAGFPGLAGLARSGRSRTKVAGARIFSRNVASARSACSGGKSRDGVRRGG